MGFESSTLRGGMVGVDRTPGMPGAQAASHPHERKGPAMVRARFWVREIAKYGNTDNVKVTLAPVTRSTSDNVEWSKYTPSGEITLQVTAEGAQRWFEERLGKDVAITFDDVEE